MSLSFAQAGLSVLVSLLLLVLLSKFVSLTRRRRTLGLPSIPSNSLFGYSSLLFHGGQGHQHQLSLVAKHGPLMQYNFLGSHRIAVADAQVVKTVLKQLPDKGFALHADGRNSRGEKSLLTPSLFLLTTGPEWQLRRDSFKTSFSMTSVRSFQGVVKGLLSKCVAKLHDLVEQGNDIVEVDALFGQMTTDVICQVGFGYDIKALEGSELSNNLHSWLRRFFELTWVAALPMSSAITALPLVRSYSPFAEFRSTRSKLTGFCALLLSHLRECSASGSLPANGLGSALLRFSSLPGITVEHVLAEIEVLFIAGHETTAHSLSFFVYCLATNADVQRKAQRAVDEHDRENKAEGKAEGKAAASSTIPPYLEALLKESMRLYPIAPKISRKVTAPEGLTLDVSHLPDLGVPSSDGLTRTVHLPEGTVVEVLNHALHNITHNWGPSAAECDPNRWLPTPAAAESAAAADSSSSSSTSAPDDDVDPLAADDRRRKSSVSALPVGSLPPVSDSTSWRSSAAVYGGGGPDGAISFAPFSSGSRNCIGMNLALLELRETALALVREFHFELGDEDMREPDNAVETRFTLRPKKKLPIKISRRRSKTE